jgi:hypothetical protein
MHYWCKKQKENNEKDDSLKRQNSILDKEQIQTATKV